MQNEKAMQSTYYDCFHLPGVKMKCLSDPGEVEHSELLALEAPDKVGLDGATGKYRPEVPFEPFTVLHMLFDK
jgi:hypothetical protein